MSHPFLMLAPRHRIHLFWFLFAATLAITIVMNIIGKPLVTHQAPSGIVSLELAGTPTQARAILDSWDERARQYAAFGLGFDYLYMLVYSAALGLGCIMAANVIARHGWPLQVLGVPFAWGIWLAASFDAIENIALMQILLNNAVLSSWPAIARLCALLKFGLLFLGLVYVFYALIVIFVVRLTRQATNL